MTSPFLILVASLIGSPHCAAMCGGFAAMSCNSAHPRTGQLLYNFGRMLAYVALGGAAGYIGSSINFGVSRFGVHQIASLATGLLLIFWGLAGLFNSRFVGAPAGISAKIAAWATRFSGEKGGTLLAPLLLGASSAFLPCGWLYSYVAVAGGTGSVVLGASVMLFFWLGTLPILVTIGGLSRIVTSPVKKFAPTLTALLIIAAGFFSLYDHVRVNSSAHSAEHCHTEPSAHSSH